MGVMPETWDVRRLNQDADKSVEAFKKSRIDEPEQLYIDLFARNSQRVEHVLDVTEDLTCLNDKIADLLLSGYYDVIRYLSAPPVSVDDMFVLAGLTSREAPSKLSLPNNVASIGAFVDRALDVKRFGWVRESRRATQHERDVARVSTAALLSTQQFQTARRGLAKRNQEGAFKKYLVDRLRYREGPTRRINTVFDAPKAFEFCGETPVVGKKADVVVGLGDNRFMCVECKVSNSAVNSYKRLNHETVEKANHWYHTLGTSGVVCAGLLSGVFSTDNLLSAQEDGVSIFWSHDLGTLGAFISSTYNA